METPPVHVVWNMDENRRFEAFEENEFFTDNRAMRHPVEGTVHRGGLRLDEVLYQGINEDSSFVTEIPLAVTKEMLLAGQKNYNIYCTPCHGVTGNGRGVIITGGYGFVPPPSFHIPRLRNMPAGEIYSAITNGVRTMFSYANQIPVKDRWAIVAYIRALQRSQNVSEQDLGQFNITASKVQEISPFDTTAAQAAPTGGAVSAQLGEQLITTYECVSCHSVENEIFLAPSFRNLYGSARVLSDGSVVEANEGYLIESMQYPAAKIVRGFRSEMPSYRDLMSDAEMQSVVEYLKTISKFSVPASEDTLSSATSDTLGAAISDTAATNTTNVEAGDATEG